jgi:ribose transport system substrate-binding protein
MRRSRLPTVRTDRIRPLGADNCSMKRPPLQEGNLLTVKLHSYYRAALAAVLLSAVLAGCGSSDDETKSSASGGGTDSDKTYLEGIPTLNEVMKGTIGSPPDSGPAAVPGKRVWVITCGQTLPTCSLLGDAAKQAAETLGWDLQIGDGKLSPTGYVDAMSTAMAQKPDAIILAGIACGSVQQSVQQARQAGILVLGIKAPDCDEAPTNQEALFSAPMYYNGTNEKANSAATRLRGQLAAQYLINVTEADAKIIFEKGGDPTQAPMNEGFEEEIAKCDTCEIVKVVEYVPTDQGPDGALAQGLQAALLQHPEANAVYAPYDANLIVSRGAQIVAQSGNGQLVIASDGSPDGLDLVRNGQVAVETGGQSYEWWAYAVMDSLNRLFAGEDVVDQGLGWQPVDADHNLPSQPGSPVEAPFDVPAHYDAIWKG